MAFADPQSITISAVPISLPRTFAEGAESAYVSGDGLVRVSVNHTLVKQGVSRHLLRLDHSKMTTDPFKPSENVKVGTSMYMVFQTPPAGYTTTEVLAVYTGWKTWFSASSDAVITKLLGGES
jgi:hypothetical protein